MKKWIMRIGILLVIILCTACSLEDYKNMSEIEQDKDEIDKELEKEIPKMTEQQEEVFRSYGLTEEEIEKMKIKGLSVREKSFVDTAILMLNYLEEKYEEKFQVVGGDIPGLLTNKFWIAAEACEGDYAGEQFEVGYYDGYGFRDGYMAVVKQEEACEALIKLIQGVVSEFLIFLDISGEYGDEITFNITGDELLKLVEYSYTIVLTNPELSEEEFNKISENIEKVLEENGVSSSGSVRYINEEINPNITEDELYELGEKKDDFFKWNYFISTYR